MNRSDIKLAARTLAGFLAAGLSMTESLKRMWLAQPRHADVWINAYQVVSDGRPLSQAFVNVWPSSLIEVVKAGEASGKLEDNFRGIHDALVVEEEVMRQLKQALYPLFMLLAGLVVGIFYMVAVIPGIAENLKGADSWVMDLSLMMRDWKEQYGWQILIATAVASVAALHVLRSPETRESLANAALSIPYVNKAIADLRFGLWARYLALSISSGIGTIVALKNTVSLVQGPMRNAVMHLINDLEKNRSMEEAVNLEALPADDPRQEWLPFFICTAFSTATQTGRLDESLQQISPELIWQGTERINRAAAIGKAVALGLAAAIIVAPLGIAYLQIIQSMENVL